MSGALGACLPDQFRASHREAATVLRFDGQLDVHWAFLLAERAAKFRQRDILQLPNPFPCNTKLLSDFFERLGLAAVQAKSLENDLLLTIIQHIEQTADFVAEIFVTQ